MRIAALAVSITVFAALSVAFATTRGDAARPALGRALLRTAQAPSQRYELNVRIAKAGAPLNLHVRGQANAQTISVRLRMGSVTLPDGRKLPGPNAAALLDGPFLYEQAPSGIAVLGKFRWLRLPVESLSPSAPELKALHALTPAPLLRVF